MRLSASNVFISVQGDGQPPTHVCTDEDGGWNEGGDVSLESLPAHPSVHALFASKPSKLTLTVNYIDESSGDAREINFVAATE